MNLFEIITLNKPWKKRLLYTSIVIVLIGLAVSLFLWYEYSQPKPLVCSSDCEKVRVSKYANLYGISLPILGVFFYITLLIPMLWGIVKKSIPYTALAFTWMVSFGGFGFSVYLTYLEIWVIKGICQWCVVSATCSTLLFVLTTMLFLRIDETKSND